MADPSSSGDQSYDFAAPDPPKPKATEKPRPKPPAETTGTPKVSTAKVSATPAPPAETPKTQTETNCPFCGFTLYGPPKARCPECAAPMDKSAADLIKFSDPTWVRSVAAGLLLLAVAIAVHIAGSALQFMKSFDTVVAPSKPAGLLHVAGAALLVFAVFKVTRPAPSNKTPASAGRTLARWTALIALVLWTIIAMIMLKWIGSTHGFTKTLVMLTLIDQAITAASLGFICGDIASNIPDDSLASHSVNGGWLLAILCASLTVIQAFELTTRVHIMFFTCSFPMIAGLLVIALFGMITLLRLALEMRTSASEGEEIQIRRAQRAAAIAAGPVKK